MKTQRLAMAVTLLNVLLLVGLLMSQVRSTAATQTVAPVLRAHALEIVDAQGRVRASLTVEPPITMDGRAYPETVLLRMTDPGRGPLVKLTASDEGSALGLSDDAEGGVQVYATRAGNFVKVVNKDGREQVLKP